MPIYKKIYMSMTKRQIYTCLKMRYIVLRLLHVCSGSVREADWDTVSLQKSYRYLL